MSEKESKGAMPSRAGGCGPMPLGAFVKEEEVAQPMPPGACYKEEERSDDRRKMRRERSETIFRRGSVLCGTRRVFDQPIWALRF